MTIKRGKIRRKNISQDLKFYFYPTENINRKILVEQGKDQLEEEREDWGTLGDDEEKEQKLVEKGIRRTRTLTMIANNLKNNLESVQVEKWEITLEGYLEISSGALPGGKAGFKATLKLSNG